MADLPETARSPTPQAMPMVPRVGRVRRRRREGPQVVTLEIGFDGAAGPAPTCMPGQFNMLTAFGVGEVPIGLSGELEGAETLIHTIRAVGLVSSALAGLGRGDPVGVRGPFGAGWPMTVAPLSDVVIVAGGLGLAPLRPVLYRLMAERDRYGNVVLLYGTRRPEEILFRREIEHWREVRLDAFFRRMQDQLGHLCAPDQHHEDPRYGAHVVP